MDAIGRCKWGAEWMAKTRLDLPAPVLLDLDLRHRRPAVPAPVRQRAGSKYRNQTVLCEDGRFDSKAEYAFWCQLKLLEREGRVANVRRQVVFELVPGVVLANRRRPPIRYVADFVYQDCQGATEVVADVKGMLTDVYRLKRHLMKAVHGIDIVEIKNGKGWHGQDGRQ